jgi:acetyl-CoA acetyltransferase
MFLLLLLASMDQFRGNGVLNMQIGVPPRIMGVGPVYAIPMVLQNSGITQDEVDLFEVKQ